MSLKIKDIPLSERPYEKLENYGAEILTNSELLAIIIKTGTKSETSITLAQKILNLRETTLKEDLSFLQDVSIKEFTQIKGIGKVKAIQLKAVAELCKRAARPINQNKKIVKTTKDVVEILMPELKNEKREIVKLVILTSKNAIQKIVDISLGNDNSAKIEPKYIILEAIKLQATKIILVHNHPSGDSNPSKEDYRFTDRIYECADLMGIELLDHIIIGLDSYTSLLSKQT
ncbi:MAG: DNA repair protein RadC [Lachnospiraceae bacterium]|jgi:DNA repair protein RadC|nr:DNA repair protein RadC [Lachnospiraceae bacterium]